MEERASEFFSIISDFARVLTGSYDICSVSTGFRSNENDCFRHSQSVYLNRTINGTHICPFLYAFPSCLSDSVVSASGKNLPRKFLIREAAKRQIAFWIGTKVIGPFPEERTRMIKTAETAARPAILYDFNYSSPRRSQSTCNNGELSMGVTSSKQLNLESFVC